MTALKVKLNPTAGLCDGHVAPQTANGFWDNLEISPPEICELGNPQALWASGYPRVTPWGPAGTSLPWHETFVGGFDREQAIDWFLGDIKVPIYTFQNTSANLSRCPCGFPCHCTPTGSAWKSFPISYCLLILQHNLNQSKAREPGNFLAQLLLLIPSAWFYIKSAQRSVGWWWRQVSCCARGSQLGTTTTVCLLEQRMPFV